MRWIVYGTRRFHAALRTLSRGACLPEGTSANEHQGSSCDSPKARGHNRSVVRREDEQPRARGQVAELESLSDLLLAAEHHRGMRARRAVRG